MSGQKRIIKSPPKPRPKSMLGRPNREKIAKYLHLLLRMGKPIAFYLDWESESEDTRNLFRGKARHIEALFPDESEINGKIKLTVETELALERDIIRSLNEAKIEEAKREEKGRVLGILQKEYPAIDTWQCYKTLQGD